MRERKESGLYLKEIFKFRQGDDYYGLVVQDVLFFKMNRVTWELLDAFPDIKSLTTGERSQEYREAVDSLLKNGIIAGKPQSSEDSNIAPGERANKLNSLGLCLREKGRAGDTRTMSMPVIRRSIDFLFDASGQSTDLTLLFISDNVPASLEAMTDAVSYASERSKERHKTIHFALRTPVHHLSPRCTWFLRDNGIAVEFEIKAEDLKPDLNDLSTAVQDQMAVVTLNPAEYSKESLERAIERLNGIGLNHVYLETSCSHCQGVKGAFSGMGLPGLINSVPFIYTVMTSAKIKHGCRAGNDYAAVAPDGEIYACHRKIQNRRKRFRLGSLSEGLLAQFPAQRPKLREECQRCEVRYFCGAGAGVDHGSPSPDYCRAKRQLIQQALATFPRLTPRQKRATINIYKQMASAMPFRWPPPREAEVERINRQLKVAGSSMKPMLKEGDIVLVEPPADVTLKWGDIICFGKPATCHRVIWKSQRRGQTYVLEKGDNQVGGSRIPVENISGKVVAVRKDQRIFKLDNASWGMINRLMALTSLMVFGLGRVFKIIPKSKQ